jgi:hypothetical protein
MSCSFQLVEFVSDNDLLFLFIQCLLMSLRLSLRQLVILPYDRIIFFFLKYSFSLIIPGFERLIGESRSEGGLLPLTSSMSVSFEVASLRASMACQRTS